jgi:hypothetical protein
MGKQMGRRQPTQGRFWSAEEEEAVKEAVELVRGRHWGEILKMYGRKGSVKETLKNTSRVAIKHKAVGLADRMVACGEVDTPFLRAMGTTRMIGTARGPSEVNATKEKEITCESDDEEYMTADIAVDPDVTSRIGRRRKASTLDLDKKVIEISDDEESPSDRRQSIGPPSCWSSEEEEALIEAVEFVQGPH